MLEYQEQKTLVSQPVSEELVEEAEHGWVAYNSGPCEWFWAQDRGRLEHELTDEIRPATALEKYLLNKQDDRTHEHDDPLQPTRDVPVALDALSNDQREAVLLCIIAGMGGTTDSSESKWSWLNWFCSDEVSRKQSDTFNRCHEKGWLQTSHDTSFDSSTTWITPAGRAVLGDAPTSAKSAFAVTDDQCGDWQEATPGESSETSTDCDDAGDEGALSHDLQYIGEKIVEMTDRVKEAHSAVPGARAEWVIEADDVRFRIAVTVDAS